MEICRENGIDRYGQNPEIPVKMTENTGSQEKIIKCSARFVPITARKCKEI
jgi:hypothetical protein